MERISNVSIWNGTMLLPPEHENSTDYPEDTTTRDAGFTRTRHGPILFIYSTVVVFCLEAILGAFLNTLTIMSVIRFDKLWTPPNILIISLSIGDCLPLIARVFTILDVVLVDIDREGWRIVCYLQTFFTSVSHGLNVHTIADIAIERAVSVLHPIWSRNNVTIKSTQTAAVVIWFFVVTKKILEIVFGNKTTDELNGDCTWVVVLTRKTILYSVQPEFVLASVITLSMYVTIIWNAKKLKTKVTSSSQGKNKRQQRQLKINRMMGTGKHGFTLFRTNKIPRLFQYFFFHFKCFFKKLKT